MTAELPVGLTLRAAAASDLADVATLLALGEQREHDVAARLAEFHVAVLSDAVIGVIALRQFGGDALLDSLVVDTEWRGRGLAARLVEHALTEAALEAMDAVYLLSITPDFFARFGFLRVPLESLPFTVTRALARSGSTAPDATPMYLRLSEP